jgi:hypothetical protein
VKISVNISGRIKELLKCVLPHIPKVFGSNLSLEHILVGDFRAVPLGAKKIQE